MMSFKTIRGREKLVGFGLPVDVPINIDAAVYAGAVVYGSDGRFYSSNGALWQDVGTGIQGLQGTQGIQGRQGLQGGYGPSIRIIGSVLDVNVDPPNDPQQVLSVFISPVIGDGVLDLATGDLWVWIGSTWTNVGRIQGPQGLQGLNGFQGAQGVQGTQGRQGIQGSTGIQGSGGTQGAQGTQGTQGSQGVQGIQGIQGTQGSQGVQGTQGSQGVQGRQGVQGTQGEQGSQGVQGQLGIQGAQGTQGTQGLIGRSLTIIGTVPDVNVDPPNNPQTTLDTAFPLADTGDGVIDEVTGDLWVNTGTVWDNVGQIRGPQGVQGVQGVQGTQGAQGVQGTQGFQGTQGIQGTQGTQGTQGQQGAQGTQGTQGIQGPQGTQGTQGVQGPQGTQGLQGRQGLQGGFGPSLTIVGNVADVNVIPPGDPQATLNAAFPSATTGSGVIDGATGNLWVYDGADWVNVGQIRGPQGIQGTVGQTGAQGSQGIQGLNGIQGSIGSQGTQGRQGIQGTSGPSTTINAANDTSATTHYPVFVAGTGNQTARIRTTANALSYVPSTGTLSATNFNSLSDATTKKNVVTINNAIDKVLSLRGVFYNRDVDGDDKRYIGVIAQEVEEILPEVVETNEFGYKTVSYGNIVGLLIEAIKEQNEMILKHENK